VRAVEVSNHYLLDGVEQQMTIVFNYAGDSLSEMQQQKLSVFFLNDNQLEYLGGSIDTTNATISVTVGRTGVYVLAAGSRSSSVVLWRSNTQTEFSARLLGTQLVIQLLAHTGGQPVQVQLFSVQGRLLHSREQYGASPLYLALPGYAGGALLLKVTTGDQKYHTVVNGLR
jgi:hypothetical protein